MHRYLRPSMLQHLLRRLVFDVPILNEYAKMPLKVCLLLDSFCYISCCNDLKDYIVKEMQALATHRLLIRDCFMNKLLCCEYQTLKMPPFVFSSII